MPPQKIILLAIGALLLAAAGIFMWQSQLDNPVIPGLSNLNPSGINQNMSFSQLMQMGENYTCTFSDTSEDSTVTGTVYIAASENKFRTDYSVEGMTPDSQEEMETDQIFGFDDGSMISDGEYMYVWNSTTNEGFKMKFDPESTDFFSDFDMNNEDEDGPSHLFDQDQEMEYNCQPWRVDNSKFIPPTTVTFTDFSAQFEQMESMMDSMQLEENAEAGTQLEANYDMSEMCTLCNQLPTAEAQEECLTSLGC